MLSVSHRVTQFAALSALLLACSSEDPAPAPPTKAQAPGTGGATSAPSAPSGSGGVTPAGPASGGAIAMKPGSGEAGSGVSAPEGGAGGVPPVSRGGSGGVPQVAEGGSGGVPQVPEGGSGGVSAVAAAGGAGAPATGGAGAAGVPSVPPDNPHSASPPGGGSSPPDELVGWGEKTTGGAGGPEVTVTSIPELHDALAKDGPLIINVKGQLVHDSVYPPGTGDDGERLWFTSNKTLQGADSSASFTGNLTNRKGATNIIIRNITLSNPDGNWGTGDAVEFTNDGTNIWVDHVTFGQCADGALDFKRGVDFATVSWCKFAYTDGTARHNYANLVGHSDKYPHLDRGKLRVTFHHNWYTAHAHQRMPRVRYGQVHVFNNYYAPELRKPEQTGTGRDYVIGVGVEAQVLLEASYFENPNGSTWFEDTSWFNWYPANKCDVACSPGKIQWTPDNVFSANTSPATWAENSDVFDPPYQYRQVLQTAEDAKKSVMERAGVLK